MTDLNVTVEVLSPIRLDASDVDANSDVGVIQDRFGFPYVPAHLFKELLYESAVEVGEMFSLAEPNFDASAIEEIFYRQSPSDVRLNVPDLYVKPYDEYQKFCADWEYLQSEYGDLMRPQDILNSFTTVRYQSLHKIRVVDAGVKFYGRLSLENGDEKHLQWLALAIRNLKMAGSKQRRRFGRVVCSMECDGKRDEKLINKFLKGATK